MPLTPLDIYNKEFKHSFRGYHEDEVNEFLDEVVRDYEAILRENEQLKEQLSGVADRIEQYRKLEETLKNALVVAQNTAEEVKQAARREAELIVREAEAKAQQIVAESEQRVREHEERLQHLKREWDVFRARLRNLLQTQLDVLDERLESAPTAVAGDTVADV
jgi:cell division initiation protein